MVVCMQDCFLTQYVMSSMLKGLNQSVEFLLICVVVEISIQKSFKMIGNRMTSLFKYCTNSILRGIILDLKCLSEVWQLQDRR